MASRVRECLKLGANKPGITHRFIKVWYMVRMVKMVPGAVGDENYFFHLIFYYNMQH